MERTWRTHADVVIVGSGPAGATYARILSELRPGATIALFEVGPALTDPPGMHVKNILDDEERSEAQRRSQGPDADVTQSGAITNSSRRARPGTFLLADGYQQEGEDGLPAAAMSSNVGGMGAHWTGACPRPGGAERPDFVEDLDELLDEAERLLAVSKHAFDDAPFSDIVRERLSAVMDEGRPEGRRTQPMPLAVQRHPDGRTTWSGSDVVFGDVTRSNPDFTLTPEALVTRVLVEDGAVQGVTVRDMRTGDEHVVRSSVVVVAGDALRTPQLLWASGVRPAALGRYLNDQPQVVDAVRLRDIPAVPEVGVDPRGTATIVKQSGVSWVPYTDEDPFHGQVMQLDASPVKLAADDEPAPGSIVGLGWFCAKDLQADDRVEFVDSATDSYGMPAMRIHYTLTERDREAQARASATVRRAAEALGEPLGPQPIPLAPGASLHYQGSVRMGEVDDGTSVCDPSSEVWGVSGLYVAGNGVIPTSIACNPTLTAVALGIAGARSIARKLT